MIGYKGIEDAHDCFSAFPYLEDTGKERFGPDFVPSEWCDCYVLESSQSENSIDCQPDILAIEKRVSLKVSIFQCFSVFRMH